MFTSITVAGVRVEASMIPKRKMIPLWRMVSEEPFPHVRAFQLRDDDFDYVVESSKTPEDEKREMREWGRVLSPEGTDAMVCNPDEPTVDDYLILIREHPYHSLTEVIRHELSHIARGDL